MGTSAAHCQALMLSSVYASHARRSGYGLLSEYISGAELITGPRADPARGLPLFGARVARRFSFSRWYLGGCASMEWKAWQRLRRGFAGVIHSMWADHDLGYLDLMPAARRQAFVGTFHNCLDTFPLTIRYPSRLKRFAAIVLMSETQRSYFLKEGVNSDKVHVILHGVDTSYFTPGNKTSDHPFVVLSVGGYRRNFGLLAKICAAMRDTSVQFSIVAPEAFRATFSDFSHVRFESGITDEQLLREYQSASCLLHVAENATANNVLLEAMSCGMPIVCERLGGIPEYVNGDCADLSAPGDAEGLISAIQRLRRQTDLQQRRSSAARLRAEELDWSKVASKTTELYRSLS